jgi:hypothetical protein
VGRKVVLAPRLGAERAETADPPSVGLVSTVPAACAAVPNTLKIARAHAPFFKSVKVFTFVSS